MPDRVQRDRYRSALPGWPRGLREELAAEYCGLSVNGLRAKVDAGEIRPARHHSAGRIVYLKDNLDAYLDRLFGAVDVASPSEVDLVAECDRLLGTGEPQIPEDLPQSAGQAGRILSARRHQPAPAD